MSDIKVIENKEFHEERALFHEKNLVVKGCTFDTGESPLKESANIEIEDSKFLWKYPLWYAKDIKVLGGEDGGRAGIWYTDNIEMTDTMVTAPKNFRRCTGVKLNNVSFPDAQETFWSCKDASLKDVSVEGDYFAMNCENLEVDHLTLNGNYGFDGCKNITIRNSVLNTKDAFWNCENVTVYDSKIIGEYFGWNSKNVTLINCSISSLQGLCYIENLVMKNCTLPETVLAFEYSNNMDVEVKGKVESVLNPGTGMIRVDEIGTLIISEDREESLATEIICDKIDDRQKEVDWNSI